LRLRRVLTATERETLFYWGCLVAFADRGFNDAEHAALQAVATGFGIPGQHARRLFLHAKHRAVGTGDDDAGGQRAQRPAAAANGRERALEILGLGPRATPVEIRRRHRELVRKHHPDAHAHLGPRAASEATERFREIQAAYEELLGMR